MELYNIENKRNSRSISEEAKQYITETLTDAQIISDGLSEVLFCIAESIKAGSEVSEGTLRLLMINVQRIRCDIEEAFAWANSIYK